MTRQVFTLFVLIGMLFSASCSSRPNTPTSEVTPKANMPNPASVYCEQNGGRVELRPDASGAVAGVCVFPDGSECDEWAYYRGECQPGNTLIPTAESAVEGWQIYRNDALGYSFYYPADATISTADDPLKTLSVIGPIKGDDHWPVIFISHPSDRPEYRPSEGADLAQWLTDHDLLVGDRQPDMQIAGSTAIHTRKARSPQSYAADQYFFVRSQQLYSVVILHTGDHEDWELYNRFLESIRFES